MSPTATSNQQMKIVDLFCGCGGFSLGAHRAGYDVSAAFDIDPILTSSFHANFPRAKCVVADVAELKGDIIRRFAGRRIDGIFGGPPCQGFSEIGRRDEQDPRRQLLGHFFRLVSEVNPKFFIMENVKGLNFRNSRGLLNESLDSLAGAYAIFGPAVLDAADYGAATKRPRLFVVGIHRDQGAALSSNDLVPFQRSPATVRDAIADLCNALPLESDGDFDRWRITKRGSPHSYARNLRSSDGTFTSHRIVQHRSEVILRFSRVPEGGVDQIGRHPRLAWEGQCPTLRAGTGSDRGSFQAVRPLHPRDPRVITVREAARLQGFPDEHRFHPTIWHSFRMIGNSVSPIMAEAIFRAVSEKLDRKQSDNIAA
jgi:DNA (cytosine-5)-methyltransferase 1